MDERLNCFGLGGGKHTTLQLPGAADEVRMLGGTLRERGSNDTTKVTAILCRFCDILEAVAEDKSRCSPD